MGTSKILFDGVGIDLTADTVTEEKLLSGETAHDANGDLVVGTYEPSLSTYKIKFWLQNRINDRFIQFSIVTTEELPTSALEAKAILTNENTIIQNITFHTDIYGPEGWNFVCTAIIPPNNKRPYVYTESDRVGLRDLFYLTNIEFCGGAEVGFVPDTWIQVSDSSSFYSVTT